MSAPTLSRSVNAPPKNTLCLKNSVILPFFYFFLQDRKSSFIEHQKNNCLDVTAQSLSNEKMRKILTGFSIVLFLVTASCAKKQVIGEPAVQNSPALGAAAGKKILIIVSAHPKFGEHEEKTGYWLSEVTHFYHVMAQHGFKIDVASPEGRPGVMDPSSNDMGDSLNRTFWENPGLKQKLEQPLDPKKLQASDYAVIYFAGGHGTMWDFPSSDSLARLSASIYEQGGIVSAVCHGPAGLLNIKLSNGEYLIKGKRLTGFANFEEKLAGKTSLVPYLLEDALKEKGGLYSKAFFPFAAHAVTDNRLVTGQNPGSATGVAEHVIAVLSSK